ncbi:hypothetical protein [Bacillus sp. 2205SS5-2]|uniref:hypothetical protein n=1 Tax=Bacillus sp. 2205SS5-2 TaxID=3109031 RepID=UPI0030048E7C
MNYFIKINIISIVYSLLLLIPVELMVNAQRISRITELKNEKVLVLNNVTTIIILILGTLFVLYLSKKWIKESLLNFLRYILWIPYFVFFSYITTRILPDPTESDIPSAGLGLLLIGAVIIFPLYIFLTDIIRKSMSTS